MKSYGIENECKGREQKQLVQDATLFYVDKFMSVNTLLTGMFLSFTQTHSVIPHVGTDTHSLRGGIGLVNLPIISSHRCNQSYSTADDTYVIPLWRQRCTGEIHGKKQAHTKSMLIWPHFPIMGERQTPSFAAYVFPKKLRVSQDTEINLPFDLCTFSHKYRCILHASSHKRERCVASKEK